MPNYPNSLPSATPADHGEVVDEIRAMAGRGTGVGVQYGSDLWYSPPMFVAISGRGDSIGDIRVFRVDFPPGTTITGLGINVATAGGTGASKTLLIYNDDGTSSFPTTLQKQTSALDTTTGGVKSETFSAEDVSGTRWLGTLTLNSVTQVHGTTQGMWGVGASSITLANVVWTGYLLTGQGSAPSTWPSTRTPVNGVDRVFYRIG